MALYHNRRQAAQAMRNYMVLEGYSSDEIRLASGARTRYLSETDTEKRWYERYQQSLAMTRSLNDVPTSSSEPLFPLTSNGKLLQESSTLTDGDLHTDDQIEGGNWWDDEYSN